MRVGETEARLRTMLIEAGLDLERLDPHRAWAVFKEFAALPVAGAESDPDDDMFAVWWETSHWTGVEGAHFGWTLVRQFSLYGPAGAYDHMEHLQCLVLVPSRPELDQLGNGDGSFWPSTHLAEFVSDVENSETFAALRDVTVAGSWIAQTHV